MSLVRKFLCRPSSLWFWACVSLMVMGFSGIAWGQVGCVPNPNLTPLTNSPAGFVDGCRFPAAALNSLMIPPAVIHDNLTGGIVTSRTSFLVSSDGTTPDSLIGANINYQAIAGVVNAHTGDTLTNSAAISGFALDNVPKNGSGGSNVLAFYGNILTKATNANGWGINTVCTTTLGFAGQACLNEFDINSNDSRDIVNGIFVTGASTVQPTTAVAVSVGLLNQFASGPGLWTQAFFSQNGCCTTGLELGALAASGASVLGQPIITHFTDGSSVAQTYNLQATATSFNFSGSQTTPNFQFGGNLTVATGFGIRLGADAIAVDNSHVVTFASGASITSIVMGNGSATLNLGAVANGGAAAKYVCVDASNLVVIQAGAC